MKPDPALIVSYLEQIEYFIDVYNYSCCEKLCQILLSLGSWSSDDEYYFVVYFFWAKSLFLQQRYKECCDVCKGLADERCKFLMITSLERLKRYDEAIAAALALLVEYANHSFVAKASFDRQHCPPKIDALYSCLSNCYAKQQNYVESGKFYLLSLKENKFDFVAYSFVVQHNLERNLVANFGASFQDSPCSEMMAASIKKRLSLASENCLKRIKSTPSPQKKAFQKVFCCLA